MTMGRLEGRVAFVSGGSRGIGAAIVRRFASEGASVVIGDLRTDEAAALAAELGGAVSTVELDVTDEVSWDDAMKATVARNGAVHIVVNNAGIAEGGPLAETTLDSWRRVIDVNQTGVFLGMRAAVEPMTASGGGSIINISSMDGLVAAPRIMSYVASKWAVRGMTKVAAMELAPRNIRVNSIHPGHILTQLGSSDRVPQAVLDEMITGHVQRFAPMQRPGTVDEIAALALFLASDESSYSTGSEFVADGGFTAGYPAPGSPEPF